jgi:polysaccharide biosynthesis transport protein
MQQDLTTNIGDVFRFIRRGLPLALLVALFAGAAAYFSSSRLPETFRAKAVIAIARNSTPSGPSTAVIPALNDSSYRIAAKGSSVIEKTLESIGLPTDQRTINDFSENKVRVSTEAAQVWNDPNSNLTIEVSDGSAVNAANYTNALGNALIEWDKNRGRESYQGFIDSLSDQIKSIEEQIRTLQAQNDDRLQGQIDGLVTKRQDLQNQVFNYIALTTSPIPNLTVIQPAVQPLEPVSPKPIFNTVLATLLGLLATYGIMLMRNSLDMRLRDVDDLAKVSDLPVLASFPKLPTDTRRLPYEATSYLRTNLLFATSDAHPKVIVVTSARESEGKSSVALSLAESFVRNNYRTLLVDADMRKPVVAGEYRINSLHQTSLETWLKNPYGSNQAASVPINGKYYLYVIPSFQPSSQAAELLSSGFRECLEIWRKEYDVIIIDSAPILAVADTLTIAPLATGSVLVVNQQKTDRRQVRTAVDILKRIGVRVAGVVATHVSKESTQNTGYGYGYGFQDIDTKQTVIPETVTATKLSKTKR